MMQSKITEMDAAALLAVRSWQASDLFGQGDAAKSTFRKLAGKWHPDFCGDPMAARVFAHIVRLRDSLTTDMPDRLPSRRFTLADGRAKKVAVLYSSQTDSGELLVLPRSHVQRFAPDMADLADDMMRTVGAQRFADAAMEREMRRFLPQSPRRLDLRDGGCLLVSPRDAESIPLSAVMEFHERTGITIAAKDVAWIGSGLMNIAAWLAWSWLMHGAIDGNAVFINPRTHDVQLSQAWEYTTPFGARPRALPERTLRCVPALAATDVPADAIVDRLLVRDLLRRLLGDPSDSELLAGAVLPDPVARWLIFPPAPDAFADYAAWQAALDAAWGARRFHATPFTAADILAGCRPSPTRS